MTEDGISISKKTWIRTIEPLNKLGYMDGAVDGQTAVFQSSFNTGYQQGLIFGLQLGLNGSNSLLSHGNGCGTTVTDQRRINCQICLNNTTQKTVANLYNLQQEKNTALLKNVK